MRKRIEKQTNKKSETKRSCRGLKLPLVVLAELCLLVSMLPMPVHAASAEYVPVEGTGVYSVDGKTDNFTVKYSFDSEGRIKKYAENWPDQNWNKTKTLEWNKNLVTSISTTINGETDNETHTYKNGRETNYIVTKSDGKRYDTVYEWGEEGKTAVFTQTVNRPVNGNYVISGTRNIDSKKRISQEIFEYNKKKSKVIYKYFDTGLRKSSARSGNLKVNGYLEENIEYNKNGYMTSVKVIYSDGTAQTTSFKYTMDKKKNCPKKIVKTEKYNGKTTKTTYKYTKFKKIKRVRNCDNTGNVVPLGANY